MRTPPRLSSILTLAGILLLSGCGGGGSTSTPPPPPPSFTISINPLSVSVSPGTSATVTVSLQPQNGFDSTATVTLSGLPAGVTVSPSSPFSLTTTGQVLTFTAESGAANGTYTLSFQATSGTLNASASASLEVAPPASFNVVPSNNSLTVQYGSSASTTINFSPGTGATNYTLQLAASGMPEGVTASFSPNPVAPTSPSTVTFTTPSSARAPTSAHITITATRSSDGMQQQAQILLSMVLPAGQLPSSRTEFVRTDDTPSSIVYDPIHNLVFACNPYLSRIDVVSPASRQIVKSIPVPGAQGLSLSPDNSRLYVGGSTQLLTLIDTTSLSVIAQYILPLVNGGFTQAPALAALSNGKVLILTNVVTLFDPSSQTTPVVPGNCNSGNLFSRSADGTKVIMANNGYPGSACVYDTATNSFSPIRQFVDPAFAVAANPNGTQFAVAVNMEAIYIVDASMNILGTAPVGGLTTGMVYSPDGSYLYIVNQPSNVPIISTVNTQTFELVGTAPAYARAIAYFKRVPPLMIETPMAADSTGLVFGSADHGLALDDSTFYQTFTDSIQAPTYVIVASPAAGPVSSPTPVQILTQSFSHLPDVWFGEQLGTNAALNGAGQVQATAPPSATPGPVNIRVFTTDGTVATMPQGFTYGGTPAIYGSLGAASGGGATVDLFGYGYGVDYATNTQEVKIGGLPAPVTGHTLYPTQAGYPFPLAHLQVTAPTGSPGAQDIAITSPSGTTTIPEAFHYLESVVDYSNSDTLLDVLYDQARQQLYLSAGNHVDVFSLSTNTFLAPIIPPTLSGARALAGLALTPDSSKLLVANFGDDSVAIINPDAPASAIAIRIVPPGTQDSPVPAQIAATSLNTAFVDVGNTVGVVGGGSLYILDLGTLQVSKDGDPAMMFLNIVGDSISSSKDGAMAFIAVPALTPGAVMVWSAATNAWVEHSLRGPLQDGATSGDGNIFSSVGSGIPSFELDVSFLDSLANVLGIAGLPDFLIELSPYASSGYLNGHRLHDSGSLVYVPFANGVDIFDVRHGDLRERIFLTEQMSNGGGLGDLSSRQIHNMAIDETGQRIFLITNKGLTVAQLDSVPLSIGSVTPASGPAGTQVKIRGSGFAPGATASANGTPAAVSYVDADTLQVTLPSLPAGAVQITITNPDGQSYTLDDAFIVK